jgi:subtilisin family serine protease
VIGNTPTTFRVPPDPLLRYDISRRLPWVFNPAYTSDAYAWHIKNTHHNNALFLDGIAVGDEEGSLDMGILEAWKIRRDSSVRVAVIDALGFDAAHPELAGNVVEWLDMSRPDQVPITVADHGTQVAGLIGAQANGRGSIGICWRVPLYLYQVSTRTDWAGEVVRAIDLCIARGIRVVCIPNNVPGTEEVELAFIRAASHDIIFVVSAVNESNDHDTLNDYPTTWRMEHVFTISNCMRTGDLLPGGAGWGQQTVFAGAPGRRLPVLTAGGGYAFSSGTSEACGVAAGLVALVRSEFPQWNFQQIRQHLADTVTVIPSMAGQTITGGMLHGRAVMVEPTVNRPPTDQQ